MIGRHRKTALAFFIPSVVLQFVGQVVRTVPGEKLVGSLILLVGTVLLVIGMAYYAKAKGRHPAWGLMGLLSLFGALLVESLREHEPESRTERDQLSTDTGSCTRSNV
jgi:hypothetical protein